MHTYKCPQLDCIFTFYKPIIIRGYKVEPCCINISQLDNEAQCVWLQWSTVMLIILITVSSARLFYSHNIHMGGCKWINKCINTKFLITVLTKLAWQAISHIMLMRGYSSLILTRHQIGIWATCQVLYYNVPGVSLWEDLDQWINYHSNAHKPRSCFFVLHSIKSIQCRSTLAVSQCWSCFLFVSSDF